MEDLESWLREGYPRCFRTAWLMLRNRGEAEEVVQEAYLRVWRFRTSVPEPPGRDAWLYRVVVNAAISRLRADRHWRDRTGDSLLSQLSARDDPPASAEERELAATVIAALGKLPEPLRIPVILRYYAGLSEREIATAIGRRPGTVKSRLYDARARLSEDSSLAAWAGELTGTAVSS